MNDNERNFNYFEKLFLKISLGLVGLGVVLFITMFAIVDILSDIASDFANVVAVLLLASIASFFIAIIRIFKYILIVSKRDEEATITKSIISFFVSPIAIIIYYLMIFILAVTGCTIV